MNRRLVFGLACAVASAACAGQSADPATSTPSTVDPATVPDVELERYNVREVWRPAPSPALTPPTEAWRIPIGRTDDQTYVLTDSAVLIVADRNGTDVVTVRRLDTVDASTMWETEVAASGAIDFDLDADESVVALVEDTTGRSTRATVLDTETGEALVSGDGDNLHVDTVPGVVLLDGEEQTTAFDRDSGDVLWTSDRFISVDGGRVFATTFSSAIDGEPSSLAQVDSRTGGDIWVTDVIDELAIFGNTEVRVIDDLIFFTDFDESDGADIARITARDIDDLTELWTTTVESAVEVGPKPFGDDALVVRGSSLTSVLDRETGALLWDWAGTSNQVVRIDGEPLVVSISSSLVTTLDADGELVAQRNLDRFVEQGLRGQLADGVMYRTGENRDEIIAVTFPADEELWRVPVVPGSASFPSPIDGGFAVVSGDAAGGDAELVAYR